jgi:hypothetical protein
MRIDLVLIWDNGNPGSMVGTVVPYMDRSAEYVGMVVAKLDTMRREAIPLAPGEQYPPITAKPTAFGYEIPVDRATFDLFAGDFPDIEHACRRRFR